MNSLMVMAAIAICLPTASFGASPQQCDTSQPETTPSSRFRVDEAAGTVLDAQTNLTWKRCAEGQHYVAERCEGGADSWKWDDAAAKFGVEGSEWRLPNRDELSSIVEKRCRNPAINASVFPDTPSSVFWSGSPNAGYSSYAWGVYFNYGGADGKFRSDYNYVRLVRGGQWFDPSGTLYAEFQADEARRREQEARRREQEARNAREEEEKRRKQEELRAKVAELMQAEKNAVIACKDKPACDKAFSLTQIYLNQTSDMKIQVATDTIVETYNPTEDGKIGLKAVRIPGKGTSALITLSASCKDEKGFHAESCRLSKILAYTGFKPFIERMLK